MKLDTTLAMGGLHRVGDLARRAEEMGFAGIFTAEAMQTPFLSHAVAALQTAKIELGTAIAVAFPRGVEIVAFRYLQPYRRIHGPWVVAYYDVTDLGRESVCIRYRLDPDIDAPELDIEQVYAGR